VAAQPVPTRSHAGQQAEQRQRTDQGERAAAASCYRGGRAEAWLAAGQRPLVVAVELGAVPGVTPPHNPVALLGSVRAVDGALVDLGRGSEGASGSNDAEHSQDGRGRERAC
jgi:hypothetical protein